MSTATDLLAELIRTPSVAADEGRLARPCAKLLEDAGLTAALVEFAPDREQLVANLGGRSAPLTITGHLDTVPATPSEWSVDPWSPEVDGGRMIGRGASDMKSGVAAALVAVAQHATRAHSCRGVQVVLTSGEETGCSGARQLPARAVVGGGPLVVAEPTRNRLVPGHKGALWLRLAARGVAAHGSAPELGDNAVVRLARAAVALHEYAEWPTHERFGPVTANVGLLRGGVQPNVVPDSAEMLLDLRTVPSVDNDELRALVASLAGDGVAVSDHVVLPPVDTPLDDPFVELVSDSLRARGLPADPAAPARYFTDASALSPLLGEGQAATPTVVLGPGEPEQCHVADEWCSLDRVDEAVEVYVDLLGRWCDAGVGGGAQTSSL
ncbi:MAG TPA: M20 family metallopeptidase [Nocardioidaceae bacterium]